MQKLRDWFNTLKPRERLLVSAGGVIVLALAVFLALVPFYKLVNARVARVEKKQADLAWMRSVAGEMQMLLANEPADGVQNEGSLVLLIDRVARECGISKELTGQTPEGDNGIRVRLEAAEFDKVLVCLGNLQQKYAVDIESANIDRASQPGKINASLILTRPAG
jgi:general secretion pathway protein M